MNITIRPDTAAVRTSRLVSLFLADERSEMLPIHLWQQIETNLDVRTAAVSGLIVMFTLILMLLAERLAGLTRQMR